MSSNQLKISLQVTNHCNTYLSNTYQFYIDLRLYIETIKLISSHLH